MKGIGSIMLSNIKIFHSFSSLTQNKEEINSMNPEKIVFSTSNQSERRELFGRTSEMSFSLNDLNCRSKIQKKKTVWIN